MYKHTYYSKNLLREVLPSIIVNDVVTMIDNELHQQIRSLVNQKVPEILCDIINIEYVNNNSLVEDFIRKFYELFGYSMKKFALDSKDVGLYKYFTDKIYAEGYTDDFYFLKDVHHMYFDDITDLIRNSMKLLLQQEGFFVPDDTTVSDYIDKTFYGL
jgi:hypothetical protein